MNIAEIHHPMIMSQKMYRRYGSIMNTIQNMDCVIAIGVGGNIGAGAGTGFEGLASTKIAVDFQGNSEV